MTLPAHKAVEQFECGGSVFYFCNASCRRKFEERPQTKGARGLDS